MKYITFSMVCLSIAITFTFCSCNTDVETIKINEPEISTQNAKLYDNYLTKLRDYKASKHKIAMAWFDNSHLYPNSQGQQIKAIPDSIDYIVLTNPYSINKENLENMIKLREKKSMKFLYEISFEKIKAVYTLQKKAFFEVPENKNKKYKSFNDYLTDSVKISFDICSKYNYDGIVISYNGKFKLYMEDSDKKLLSEWENNFIGMAMNWAKKHIDKTLIFQGKPQNVINKEIFKLSKYIIIPCLEEVSEAGVMKCINSAVVEGVPLNKFLPAVMMYTFDTTDSKTGYWVGKKYAVLGAAKWASAQHELYDIAGLAMININSDYYHPSFTYPVVRKAINILNPSIKN
ncbi:glycoside hydrolase family 18 [Prevotella amnii]|uniref:Lipoprotein n=1 Tax=Prevotella amnii DNF00058 TaxID=1401066 RepID=A0A096B2S1_9BACT|nr:glycoside hydrolase family 18 [Prevotella amnii]KGF53320.1 hypothetical protein HMPREF9302_00045 [Prevotella amnii DNF00058]